MSYLESERAIAGLKAWRNVPEHAQVIDLFFEKLKRERTDHLCRVRACVNPNHIELVSMMENTMRGDSPQAVNARKTHCVRGHEFTEENTYRWGRSRICRTCRKEAR